MFVGVGQPVMSHIFSESVDRLEPLMMCPRNFIHRCLHKAALGWLGAAMSTVQLSQHACAFFSWVSQTS